MEGGDGRSGNKDDDLGGGGGIFLVTGVVSPSGLSVEVAAGGGLSPWSKTKTHVDQWGYFRFTHIINFMITWVIEHRTLLYKNNV